jgi:pimeloyl-ACP methyl ester carboxylesterase
MQLTVDGARLDVLDEGRGPALVLLHGFGLSKASWDPVADALAPHARVVRFDFRGHGASGVTAGPYLMEMLAGDIAAVLDALEIERATIAGHSLGGYAALAFYRMFAERCAALGLVCSRATADTPAAAAAREELADRTEREGIGPVVEQFLPRSFAPAFAAGHPAEVERIRALLEATDPRGAAAMLRGMAARVSSEDLLDELAIPVAVVAGSADALIPPAEARALAAALPAAELEVLDCGHVPLVEAPAAVEAALLRLLERAGTAAHTF